MDIITKDTGIIDAVQQHPEILEVFAKYGLGCVGCMADSLRKPSAREQALTALMLKRLLPTSTRLLLLQNDLLNKKQSDVETSDCFFITTCTMISIKLSQLYTQAIHSAFLNKRVSLSAEDD